MSSSVPIAHFERKYQILSSGRIWNLRTEDYQILTQNPNGYMKVILSLNGVKEQLLVHRLVALHFIPNPYGYEQVNHIDGDKTNNDRSNLEWVNRSQNIQHSLREGLRKGYLAPSEKRNLINRVIHDGALIKDLANEIGRGQESLSGMLRRQAEADGIKHIWNQEMLRRRQVVAIRNLEKINN